METSNRPIYMIVVPLLLVIVLAGCTNGATDAPITSTPLVVPTATSEISSNTGMMMTEYASSNGVFYLPYPTGWAVNETPLADGGLAFAIAPSQDFIDNRPNFNRPILFAFGRINQVSPELAQPARLAELHEVAFGQNPLFEFELGEPYITSPSPYVTFLVMEATSTEENGAVVYWQLGTALADLTVVHYAIGVSEAGVGEYGELAVEMFDGVEIDTAVTGALATPGAP